MPLVRRVSIPVKAFTHVSHSVKKSGGGEGGSVVDAGSLEGCVPDGSMRGGLCLKRCLLFMRHVDEEVRCGDPSENSPSQ